MRFENYRLYFLIVYGVAMTAAALKVLVGTRKPMPVEASVPGIRRWLLPAFLIPFEWLVPIGLMWTRAGEIPAECLTSHLLGIALSLYAGGLLIWTVMTLGRFLVPRAVIFQDHKLITSGPFRFLRHPTYSGVLALWLGAGFGTLNGILLLAFPLALLGFFIQARIEEKLLEEKFGEAYRAYERKTARFVPGVF